MEIKHTGIIRRIDDLGRLVVPKELRRELRVQEGDAFEESILTLENGQRGIFFVPYNPATRYINQNTYHEILVKVANMVSKDSRNICLIFPNSPYVSIGNPGWISEAEKQARIVLDKMLVQMANNKSTSIIIDLGECGKAFCFVLTADTSENIPYRRPVGILAIHASDMTESEKNIAQNCADLISAMMN